MAGLNYGKNFTYSQQKRIEEEKMGLNKEGVIYYDKAHKWIVRMPNPTNSTATWRPFISVFQHADEEVARQYYSDLKEKQTNK